MTTTLDAAYFRALRKPEPVTEATEYPAPEHTSRDPWPEGFAQPGPVASLRELAESHGWVTAVTYSRARTPRSDNGKPGALAHHVVVRMFHPDSRARCVAHYVVPVGNPTGRKWLSTLIVSATIPPYAGCSITQAKEFVRASGRTLPDWLDAVRWSNLLASIRDKVWADYCGGATLAAMAAKYEQDKKVIVQIVQECRAAGRAKPAKRASGKKKEVGG